MKQFRLVDNVLGWLTFFIAAFVYCSTIEPTASFWDCPEFITTGNKLEVGHPPGAPFFMLTANLFSQFTSDPAQVARMVNMMNALLSAACILFLFWSISHLVRRLLISKWEELDMPKLVAIEASGLVGALIYTFSDTFWYSAVEGEVYAYSSAFTAVVFWLILKWEEHADEPHSDRWLVLIMYMTGLSIGVHLLNLLCLPAIVLVWYYKRYPNANLKGSLVALAVSFVILAAVLYGVVPGIITVGGWFELFFVNTLHMSFNTGLFVYLLLLIGSVIWAIYETQCATEKNWVRQNVAFLLGFGLLGVPFIGFGWTAFFTGVVIMGIVAYLLFMKRGPKKTIPLISARLKNTVLLCMLMLMIGYSTYAVIVIRSSANPPMDQNSPEDIFTLGTYLSRDQYGYRPLLWGQGFDSEYRIDEENNDIVYDEGAPVYHRVEKTSDSVADSYFIVLRPNGHGINDKPVYEENMFFPRMYSNDPRHVQFYLDWNGGITGSKAEAKWPFYADRYRDGQVHKMLKDAGLRDSNTEVVMPTFWDNMSFFFTYQCGWMYWRYFLWNFAGRQNDLQGHGNSVHGNWLSGFSFIDNPRLGDQSLMADELQNNRGHNVYFMMPLILGLIGLFWQMLGRGRKGVQQFWVVFFLFFMTGLAIVVYLNQTPYQPRERDYAYAGSFYAYAIWCGMGVAAVITMIRQMLSKKMATKNVRLALAGIVSAVCLVVPIQMASQNWDDHDRSGRYTCRDFGMNYLTSLQKEVTLPDGTKKQSHPIIFTCGDNDTFPLWYNMDTEGQRLDARVCNLSYLNTDWYIDQMVRPAYESPALPITWKRSEYIDGTNEAAHVDQFVMMAIEQFRSLCDLDSTGTIVKREFGITPEEGKKLFGDDEFELKNVLYKWVRGQRSDSEKALCLKILKPITNWYYGINYFLPMLNECFDEQKGFDYDLFKRNMASIGLGGISYEEAVDLFGYDPFDTSDATCFYRFLCNNKADKQRRDRQLAVISKAGGYDLKLNNVIPTTQVHITIDKEAVLRSGMMIQGDNLQTREDSLNAIPDRMEISLRGVGGLSKSHLMMFEMLANANWERPLYVATTVGRENWLTLGEFFVNEGLAYRITPFKVNKIGSYGRLECLPGMKNIDTEKAYNNIMHFAFGGVKNGIYLDETVMRMCYTHRIYMVRLVQALLDEAGEALVSAENAAYSEDANLATAKKDLMNDKLKKAANVLEKMKVELPASQVPHDEYGGECISTKIADSYYRLAQFSTDKAEKQKFYNEANDIVSQLWKKSIQYMNFYMSLDSKLFRLNQDQCSMQLYALSNVSETVMRYDETEGKRLYQEFNKLYEDYKQKMPVEQ